MRLLLAALLLLAPALARAEATLTVLAAASLRAPLQASAAAFEQAHPGTKLAIATAATGVLVKQVQAGAPADVVIGAALEPIAALHASKLAGEPREVARNELVLAAPAASKAALSSLSQLAEPAFARIALGRPRVVPAGDYAEQALQHAGIMEKVRARLVYGESVTQVLTYLRRGDADAGFVYASDAQLARTEVRVLLRVPGDAHAPIVYPAAVVSRSSQPALAAAYLEFLRSPPAQAALREAGFLPP